MEKQLEKCSGVILAGGLNFRFNGQSKAFLKVNGRRILDSIFNVFQSLFDEIIIITNQPAEYLQWNCNIAADIFPVRSSLTGLHAGLFYSNNPYTFFCACDTPFLKKELVGKIIEKTELGFDVIIPKTSVGLEPLCAAYSKNCIQPIENMIKKQNFKISGFFNKTRVYKINENILKQYDPQLLSFFNINTPKDLKEAEKFL